jgi:hypothetical protein
MVQVSPESDPAAGNPFAYAADNPLDLTDPTGHAALDAHQLHLAHLAHLAGVANADAAAAHAAHVEHVAHLAYVAQTAYSARTTYSAQSTYPNPFTSYRWTGNDMGAPTASGPYAVTTIHASNPASSIALASGRNPYSKQSKAQLSPEEAALQPCRIQQGDAEDQAG